MIQKKFATPITLKSVYRRRRRILISLCCLHLHFPLVPLAE